MPFNLRIATYMGRTEGQAEAKYHFPSRQLKIVASTLHNNGSWVQFVAVTLHCKYTNPANGILDFC